METVRKGTITIKTVEGDKSIPVVLIGDLFAAHWDQVSRAEPLFNITHIPSGRALLTELQAPEYACNIAIRLLQTLSPAQIEAFKFTDIDAMPKQLAKKMQAYLLKAKRCENNTELERMVGVFYRDREECERLRMKINPEANTLLDDKAIGSTKLTTSLMMGEIKLS